MSIVRQSASIAASGANSDQLTTDGVPLETRVATQDGVVTLMAVATLADILITLLVNGQRTTIDARPVIKATGPIYPDDVVAQVPVLAGDVISMATRNTNAAANTLFYYLDIP